MRYRPRRALAVLLILLVARASFALSPSHIWSQRFGDADNQWVTAVATDASGNIYMAGHFLGTVDFGGGPLTSHPLDDIFLVKFNSAGVHQWSKSFGDSKVNIATEVQWPTSLAIDPSGNVIIAGWFSGALNMGSGDWIASTTTQHAFIAKYSPAGVHQWSLRFGDGWTLAPGVDVAVDSGGNAVLAGTVASASGGTAHLDFGGGSHENQGSNDLFVAKFSPAGAFVWDKYVGDANSQTLADVAVDGADNIIVTGSFATSLNLGGATLTSSGPSDNYLAKFSAAGAHVWSKNFGDALIDAIDADTAGGCVLAGFITGTVDFGGGALTTAGGQDVVVARFDPSGNHLWSKRFGGVGTQRCTAVKYDDRDAIMISGLASSSIDFGGGTLTSAGQSDIFAARFSSAGVHEWSRLFGSTSPDQSFAVTTFSSHFAIVAGEFATSINFGGSTLINAMSGMWDICIARFGLDEPFITAVDDVPGDEGQVVELQFDKSELDRAGSPTPISGYEVYRRNDAPPSLLSHQSPVSLSGYTQVGTVPATTASSYSFNAPTIGDSTITLGQYRSTFVVRAITASPSTFFDSPADSGYSVDNLPPPAPTNVMFSAGVLGWDPSGAADFDHFSVYGSNTPGFGTATFINTTVLTSMNVSASPYVFYFVSATDDAGNQGAPANINTLTGVGEAPARFPLAVSSYPNPFNPRTTIRYSVPARGRTTVEVYDARGARVVTLFDAVRAPGAYAQPWDGQDADGHRVGSGVYFVRVTHSAGTRSHKMVLLK